MCRGDKDTVLPDINALGLDWTQNVLFTAQVTRLGFSQGCIKKHTRINVNILHLDSHFPALIWLRQSGAVLLQALRTGSCS